MAVDLRHLRSFVAVAEEGKIGVAATRLFITQPALSRQMQELEREIGEQLFLRVPLGVELTEAGRELLPKARVAVEAADDAFGVRDEEHPHGALEGLRYSHAVDERVAVWLHHNHPLAARSELALADLHGQKMTLLGGPVGRASGYNRAIRGLFAGTGIEPLIEETVQVYPPSAGLELDYLSVTVPLDYPDGVVSVPLVPPRTLPFEFVQRAETNRAAVRAYARFAVEHLSGQVCAEGMSSA